jgi:hypothetical protein
MGPMATRIIKPFLLLLVCGLGAAACLDAGLLDGKLCDEQGACLPGYACDPDTGRCVPEQDLPDAGDGTDGDGPVGRVSNLGPEGLAWLCASDQVVRLTGDASLDTDTGQFQTPQGPVESDWFRVIDPPEEDLPALADEGKFRADLLDRLAFDVITLPPLRERSEDILPLASHFAVKMSGELGLELFPGFSESARELLLDYAWPGNVRELKNTVEREVYTSLGSDEPISEIIFDPFDSPWRPGAGEQQGEEAKANPAPTEPYDFKEHVQNLEIELLQSALKRCRFNQKKTAEYLGMTYHQLRGYLRKYELTDSEES